MVNVREPTIFARNRARRDAIVKPMGDVRLTDDQKALVLSMVSEGALLGELITRGVLPSYYHLWNEQKHDAAFEAAYKQAQSKGAQTLLNAAQEHALEMVESGDPDQVRAADCLMRITETFAEKIAPREFGQLVKLAGDSDQPLMLQVVNYAAQTIPLEVIEARAISASDVVPPARGETIGTAEAEQADSQVDSSQAIGQHSPRTD